MKKDLKNTKPKQKSNSKNKLILIIVAIISVFLICCCVSGSIIYLIFFRKDKVNLTVEDNFALENFIEELGYSKVMISEVEGGILEIRTEAFASNNVDQTYSQIIFLMNYVNEETDYKFEKIRIIFTINYVDVAFFESETKTIKNWNDKKISDEEMINNIKKFNLIEEVE